MYLILERIKKAKLSDAGNNLDKYGIIKPSTIRTYGNLG
jgi:hypothetical protein